jgi:hypothetical protein
VRIASKCNWLRNMYNRWFGKFQSVVIRLQNQQPGHKFDFWDRKRFIFATACKLALGPNQLLTQMVLEAVCLGEMAHHEA